MWHRLPACSRHRQDACATSLSDPLLHSAFAAAVLAMSAPFTASAVDLPERLLLATVLQSFCAAASSASHASSASLAGLAGDHDDILGFFRTRLSLEERWPNLPAIPEARNGQSNHNDPEQNGDDRRRTTLFRFSGLSHRGNERSPLWVLGSSHVSLMLRQARVICTSKYLIDVGHSLHAVLFM